MKTFYIYLLGAILTLFPGYAFAYELNDTDANIIGHVTDKDTKEHLAYVTIMLKGTTIGTTTDETGHYFLKNLPEGTFTVEVSSIGYKTERRTVQLTKGKTLELNFEIGEDHVALEGVVVSANRNETTRRMAPTLVNVVSVKTFENTNSTCLAQGLNFQPGCACGEQLPELRISAGAHQRIGRALYADSHRLASHLQRAGGGIRSGADSCQHD